MNLILNFLFEVVFVYEFFFSDKKKCKVLLIDELLK